MPRSGTSFVSTIPSTTYPRIAATTETLGPNPSLRTTYGYEAPMRPATKNPHRIARGENSRKSGGFGRARRALLEGSAALSMLIQRDSAWVGPSCPTGRTAVPSYERSLAGVDQHHRAEALIFGVRRVLAALRFWDVRRLPKSQSWAQSQHSKVVIPSARGPGSASPGSAVATFRRRFGGRGLGLRWAGRGGGGSWRGPRESGRSS